MTFCIRGKVKLRTPAARTVVSDRIEFRGQTNSYTEDIIDTNRPSHSLFTLDRWKYFRGVLERHWSLPKGITDGEKVDEPIEANVSRHRSNARPLDVTHSTTGPIRAALDPVSLSRDRPAASKKMHISGKVWQLASASLVWKSLRTHA